MSAPFVSRYTSLLSPAICLFFCSVATLHGCSPPTEAGACPSDGGSCRPKSGSSSMDAADLKGGAETDTDSGRPGVDSGVRDASVGSNGTASATSDMSDADAATSIAARVLLLVPAYVQQESPEEVDTVSSVLDQWGMTHDRPTPDQSFDDLLGVLSDYPLVIIVGYLVDEYLSTHRQTLLEEYASAGGTLVVVNPVFAPGAAAHGLIGTEATERRDDVEGMRLEDDTFAVTARFDSSEERYVPLDNSFSPDASRFVNVLIPRAGETQTLASATIDGQTVGALITQRAVGKGRVYALGHQLIRFHHGRCYINCFEPSGDWGGIFFRETFREAVGGHVVLKHTVPGPEDSLVLLTHDVDAFDAQHAGEWGEPGALQVAKLEHQHGARGSFFITTGEEAGPLSAELMQELCALEMCPRGAHSVLHGMDFAALPLGTCEETPETYAPDVAPTLCGEIRVSMSMLQQATEETPRSWRSPFLLVNPEQYEVLESQGILYDSSFAVGDLKFNLPLSLSRTGMFQHVFRRRAVYTMPIALEDGMTEEVDGEPVRRELSAPNLDRFVSVWVNTLLRNADNNAHTMLLMHPSFGWDVPKDNLQNKLRVLDELLTVAKTRKVKADLTVDALAEFWRAREGISIDARYEGVGYAGTLLVGEYAARNFTIEFGDAIHSFECTTCGAVEVFENRVVIRSELAPGSSHAFRANAN